MKTIPFNAFEAFVGIGAAVMCPQVAYAILGTLAIAMILELNNWVKQR